jgi:3-mercaptopyruvate sulfurtransferase SseA
MRRTRDGRCMRSMNTTIIVDGRSWEEYEGREVAPFFCLGRGKRKGARNPRKADLKFGHYTWPRQDAG